MKYFIYILLFLLGNNLLAQNDVSINLNADKNKIEIGEPLNVKLTIDYPASFSAKTIILPLITDSAKLGENIEIWETTPPFDTLIETNNGDFTKHYEQLFTVATFDTGLIDIPPVRAIFDTDTLYSNAITLTVSTTPLGDNPKLKDIKPIETDPLTTWEKIKLWIKRNLIWILLIILIPALVWIGIKYFKNKPKETIKIKETIPLNTRILSKLQNIKNEKLWQNGFYKKYYSEITDTIRQYLSERYNISTFEKTSNEILEQLRMKSVPAEQYRELEKLLRLSDMVKFAKTTPTKLENESAIEIAENFVKHTYEQPKPLNTEE